MLETEYLGASGIKVYQDAKLYRFTSDALRLAEFARVKSGDVVADCCSGSGVVGFYLYGLHPRLIKSVTFFELQPPLYELSLKSIALNGLEDKFSAVSGRLQGLDKSYYGKFSLIVCNPPYMPRSSGEHDKERSVAVCRREIELSLDELLTACRNALKFGGRVCMVHRADRLTDVICGMRSNGLEPKRLCLCHADGKAPYLFMIEAVKGGKSGLKITPSVVNQAFGGKETEAE